MFAHVKYLDCHGGSYCNVPITFIRPPFNHEDFDDKTTYEVFWSPNEDDDPYEFGNNQKTITKDGSPQAGFYKAVVLLVANTEELLEDKLKERRLRVVPEKLLKSPHTKIGEDLNTIKSLKRESKKTIKMSCDKGKAENYKKLGSIKNRNHKVEKNLKRKLNSLFDTDNTSKYASDAGSLSTEDDSEDDVVPKKLLKKSESLLAEIQSKYQVLQKKYTVLKEEREDYKKKFFSLEKKHYDILDLNTNLQKKVIHLFDKYKLSFESQHGTCFLNNNVTPPHNSSSKSLTSPHNHSSSKSVTSQQNQFDKLSASQVSDTSSDVLAFSLEAESDASTTQEITHPLNIAQQVDTGIYKDDHFSLSKDKIVAAKISIKKGPSGDSQYVKNLAAAIWSSDVLIQRSVSGRKGNFKGDGQAKPKLTPQKLNYLRDLFKERLYEENSTISEDEVNLRCRSISSFISQKIATLKRVIPTDNNLN